MSKAALREKLAEIQTRLDDISSDPIWLNDALAEAAAMIDAVETLVLPVTAPPQPASKKWCPHARVNLAQTRGSDSFNRLVKSGAEGVTEMVTVGAYCIEHACQMWSGTDCGLKTMNADAATYVSGMVDTLKAEIDESQTQGAEQHAEAMAQIDESQEAAEQRHADHMGPDTTDATDETTGA